MRSTERRTHSQRYRILFVTVAIVAGILNAPHYHSALFQISGRLTLHNKKYNVTVAEVMRRVALPESFNLSILGSYLKK